MLNEAIIVEASGIEKARMKRNDEDEIVDVGAAPDEENAEKERITRFFLSNAQMY